MRSLVPFGDSEARPSKLHDIVAFYRDSRQLDDAIENGLKKSSGGSYDYPSYEDVKPESMENPPVQHIDIMFANTSSKEPRVHSNPVPDPVPEPVSEYSSVPVSSDTSE